MSTPTKNPFVLLSVIFIFLASGYFLWAVQPDWWTKHALIDGTDRQDHAIATVGQAKHVVQKAYQYLETELASVGGAGVEVTSLYNSYCVIKPANSEDDLQLLTIGQLKYLAKPFYDRLNSVEVGLDTRAMNEPATSIYPWTQDQADDEDLSLVALGQLKFAFSFDLSGWSMPAPTITNRTDWYVDIENGGDTNGDGSEANPFKNLSTVLSLNVNYPGFVGTGDTIHLTKGEYDPTLIEISIAGLSIEGTLNIAGQPLTKVGNLKVTATDVTLKNLEFHNTELTLQGATSAKITNNVFSGSVNTSLSLIGASNNVISHNYFSSAVHQCVYIYWDETTGQSSDDNLFLSNYFTHRPSGVTNQIIYCIWATVSTDSICARNRFVDCAFKETVSGQLNKVIYDGSTWWMVVDHEYSVRFEDCYFKKADRLTAFSQFDIIEDANSPDSEWFWDELQNDEWVSPNNGQAITGDYNNWGHSPRVQFVDANDNGSALEQEHAAGLLVPEVGNYAPIVERPVASISVGKDAEPRIVDLYDVFEDVETTDKDLRFSITNTNPDLIMSRITDGILNLKYSNTSGKATIVITAIDDHPENPKTVSAIFDVTIKIDVDGDGLNDEFEQAIIDSDPNDGINSLEDVLPEADYDGDGYSNKLELINKTDPVDLADNPNEYSLSNYSLVDLGEEYRIYGISNKGHVFMSGLHFNSSKNFRRWHWGQCVDFNAYNGYGRTLTQFPSEQPFEPYFKFEFDAMNNHGEIAGVYVAKDFDLTHKIFPCGLYSSTLSSVRNFYERPVVIQRNGSTSVKRPPFETKGQYSFDNTVYTVLCINDNGDYLVDSVPYISYRNGYDVSGSVLGNFSHEYKNGTYFRKDTGYRYRSNDPDPFDCHRWIERIGGKNFTTDIKYNNERLIVGAGYRQNVWTSFYVNHYGYRFNFVGSLQNEVDYRILDLNQNNQIIGQYTYGGPTYLFEGTTRYEIPQSSHVSSPQEGEPLMLISSSTLAVQKRDPQTGYLVSLSKGEDAYAITTAEQILHQPDAQGNPTQNADWSSPTFSLISDNGNFIAGNATKNGVRHAILLLKVDIGSQTEEALKNKHVYRGDPLRNWTSHSDDLNITNTNVSKPIGSHPTLGDYVHYKAYHPGVDSALITNYKWSAVPAEGYTNLTTIEGPDDTSASEWKIEGGGVDWKSGKYDITLELTFSGGATATVTKKQTVWQRTDDVLVVGYIDEDEFPSVSGGASAYPIQDDETSSIFTMEEQLSASFRASFFADVLFGFYKTPFEPDVARRYLNRFVLQETANEQPPPHFQRQLSDELAVYDEAEINDFFSENTNYRAINRLQAEYLLDESGDIVQGPEIITKIAYRTNIGDTPPLDFAAPQSSPEVHPNSGVINTDGSTYDFHHVTHSIGVPQGFAQYASGRVGSTGQTMNSRINGGGTPWIYGLIEFEGDAYSPEHSDIVRQIFPTYWIYVNGLRVNNFPQSDPELFIQLGNSL